MRKIIFFLLFFICNNAYADCEYTIKTVTHNTQRGTILIATEYKIDGVVDPVLDVKTYVPNDIERLDDTQLVNKIDKDIRDRCENLILQAYIDNNNVRFLDFRKELAKTQVLRLQRLTASIINRNAILVEKKLLIDSDEDGQYDQEWTLRTNGTRSIRNITPRNP